MGYRFNGNFPDSFGERLNAYSVKTGIPKVTVIQLAVQRYLDEEELRERLMGQLEDPVNFAKVCKMMGFAEG